MSCDPKPRLFGVAVSWVWVPVPLRPMVSSGAFESIVTVALLAPTAPGSNVARTMQV